MCDYCKETKPVTEVVRQDNLCTLRQAQGSSPKSRWTAR